MRLPRPAARPSLEPDWLVRVFPPGSEGQRKIDAFVIADLLADVITGSPSSSGGYYIDSARGGVWNDWMRLNNSLTLEKCGFGRFTDTGEWRPQLDVLGGNEIGSGIYILPTPIPLPATLSGGNVFPSGGTGGTIGWAPLYGTWDNVPALDGAGTTAIFNSGSEKKAAVRTGVIPIGQPLRFDCSFLNLTGAGGRAQGQLMLSPNLRFSVYEGEPPMLEIARPKTTTTGTGASMLDVEWGVLHSMDAWGEFSPRDSHFQFALQSMGGRLIWSLDGHKVHLMDGNGQGEGVPISWGGYAMRFDAQNMKARIETHMLSTKGNVAKIRRRISKEASAAQTISVPRPGGHIPKGTTMTCTAQVGPDYVEYEVTLTPDEMGTLSPMCSVIHLVQEPVWVSSNPLGVDISAAVTGATINHAHPPLQAGTEGTLDIDIPNIIKLCPQAMPFIGDYCPIEISARYRNAGTGVPTGPYKGLFRGELHGTRADESAYLSGTVQFQLRDAIVKMRAPAGVVTGRNSPLDIAFMNQLDSLATNWKNVDYSYGNPQWVAAMNELTGVLEEVNPRDRQWFDVQCVQEILRQFQGPDFANSLNGGDLFRYLPDDHPPLLDYNSLRVGYAQVADAFSNTLSSASLKMQNGFVFEPPYKSDELSWINKFATDLFCTFLVGYATRDMDGWPLPLYGRYDLMLRRAKLFEVQRGELRNLGFETRPDVDFNGIWVVGNDFDSKIPLAPSLNQGEARLPYGHPNSQYATYQRLKVIETNLAISPQAAAVAAAIALAEIDNGGVVAHWPTYTFRGATDAQVGDVLYTREANLLGGLNLEWYRAAKLSHVYKQSPTEGRSWEVTASLQRMSKSQLYAFTHALGLPTHAPTLTNQFPVEDFALPA